MTTQGKNMPGPGAYNVPRGLSTVSYSFRPKTLNTDAMTTNLKSPGPGAYDGYKTITDKGFYYVSKYKSSGATTINPRSGRFNDYNPTKNVPGPGTYDNRPTIDPKGAYFVSKFHSSMCRSFSHAQRKGLGINAEGVPGPGSYRLPSEFGYYEAKGVKDGGSQSSGGKPGASDAVKE